MSTKIQSHIFKRRAYVPKTCLFYVINVEQKFFENLWKNKIYSLNIIANDVL